ncbi:hypothetical protein [Luteimonas saliphila]|uniref:hypothetical protein n=1 Tax=Luteimonas saliphila TaxID=2804919 RepID=UPI00192E1322|nr:hypothetical protein [Luteimonas saliphila]
MSLMDAISIASAVLTLIGVVIAIVEARRARIASVGAKQAAEAAREASLRSAAVLDLNSTIKALSEIKSLHRAGVLDVLPARYEALRHSVTSLRQMKLLAEPHIQKSMQSLVSRLAGIERLIDQGVSVDIFLAQVPKLNSQITRSMDDMHAVLVNIAHSEVKND